MIWPDRVCSMMNVTVLASSARVWLEDMNARIERALADHELASKVRGVGVFDDANDGACMLRELAQCPLEIANELTQDRSCTVSP